MQEKYEICLRLSQEEKERLESSAQRCGLSKTAYLRRLIMEKEVKARPSQEIKELRTEIHHIGNNINQIARSVNAGIARAADARRGLELLDRVYELMYQIAKK
jgi:predicted DNA-binding protein